MNNDIISIFHKIKYNIVNSYTEHMIVRLQQKSRGISSAFRCYPASATSTSTMPLGRSPMSVAIGTTTWLIRVRSIAMSIIRRRIRIRIMARGCLPHLGHTRYKSYTKYPGIINPGVLFASNNYSMEACYV